MIISVSSYNCAQRRSQLQRSCLCWNFFCVFYCIEHVIAFATKSYVWKLKYSQSCIPGERNYSKRQHNRKYKDPLCLAVMVWVLLEDDKWFKFKKFSTKLCFKTWGHSRRRISIYILCQKETTLWKKWNHCCICFWASPSGYDQTITTPSSLTITHQIF